MTYSPTDVRLTDSRDEWAGDVSPIEHVPLLLGSTIHLRQFAGCNHDDSGHGDC